MSDILLNIILRGISGVGKTFLRKMLELAYRKLGKKVKVINKDEHRVSRRQIVGRYDYTEEEEKETSKWYKKSWILFSSTDCDIDVCISDNTNVRTSELFTTLTTRGNTEKTIKTVVIDVGNWDSITNSKIGDNVINQMRENMKSSNNALAQAAKQGVINGWIRVPPRTCVEEGIKEIIFIIEKIINKN